MSHSFKFTNILNEKVSMDQSPRWVSVAINWAFGTSIFCWGMVREESCSVLKQNDFSDFLTLAFRDLHFGSKMAFSYHTMENLMRLWPFWRKRKFWPALKWCWFCWIFANTFISLLDICWIFVKCLLDICWIFVGYLLDIC